MKVHFISQVYAMVLQYPAIDRLVDDCRKLRSNFTSQENGNCATKPTHCVYMYMHIHVNKKNNALTK